MRNTRAGTEQIAGLLAVWLCCSAALVPEEFLLGAKVQRSLEQAATEFAKCGGADEYRTVLGVLDALQIPEKAREKLTKSAERSLERAKSVKPFERALRALRSGIDAAGSQLGSLSDENRVAAAAALLELDGECAAAHEALGHVREGASWWEPSMVEALARRARIQESVQRCLHWNVRPELGPSDFDLIEQVTGSPGAKAVWGSFEVHGSHELEVFGGIAVGVLRAAALSHAIRTDGAELPQNFWRVQKVLVLLRDRDEYDRLIDVAESASRISASEAERARQVAGFGIGRHYAVFADGWERSTLWASVGLDTLRHEAGRNVPNVMLGHMQWVSQNLFAEALPVFVDLQDGTQASSADREYAEDRRAIEERQWMQRIGEAGLHGSRSFLRWLVERNEDAPWRTTFVDHIVELDARRMLKATFVAEYLHELGIYQNVLKALGRAAQPEAFYEAVGASEAEFEERWRRWLLPPSRGLLQRLESGDESKFSREALATLAKLQEVRDAAHAHRSQGAGEVVLDEDLSARCTAHARYLNLHPEQLQRWPDAHEEYPDREGFSVEGLWGGLHSVIAPGVSDGPDAIDAWMATFYHRLPLLEMGVLAIGYGIEDGVAVLDASSLRAPEYDTVGIPWPPPGARGIPCAFRPELPNPVPGESQSNWGYPITIQFNRTIDCTLALRAKSPNGDLVDVWSLGPNQAHQKDLVPSRAYCLIPKQTLAPNTTYYVECTSEGSASWQEWIADWSFTTGRK